VSKKAEETEAREESQQAPAGTPAATETPAPAEQPAGQPGQSQVEVLDADATACYANFCRVSSTPEELILDLALNPSPFATGAQSIKIDQRIILNHYTAKRLLSALGMALQRHEQAFGVLETDVRKRVRQT